MKLAVLFLLLFPSAIAPADPAAATFTGTCGGCHTIGGGDGAGPDLVIASRKPRAEVRANVVRMQEFAGTLTAGQIDALTELLLDANARRRLAPKPAIAVNPGLPATGRRLFYGEQPLANGGVACFACHTAAGRGGNLAADLTRAHERLGEQRLIAAAEKPPYPLIKASYAAHSVTVAEAQHLAAFLAGAGGGQPVAERTRGVQGIAAGAAFVLLGVAAFVFRPRR